MNKMDIKRYFLIGMGSIDGVLEDIDRISETAPKFVKSTNTIMITFTSAFTAVDIKELLNQIDGRSFMVFELNDETAAVNLPIKRYYEHLFGEFLEEKMEDNLISSAKSEKAVNEISGATGTTQTVISKTIEEYTEEEKMDLAFSLIEKGWENLTDEDKETLKKVRKGD